MRMRFVHDAMWLRQGVDQAVKDKLAKGDHTSISYNDIQTGILKRMEKANVLGASIEESRDSVNVIENLRLMLKHPDRSNFDLPKGDFSKLKDDYAINKLINRNNEKEHENSAPK